MKHFSFIAIALCAAMFVSCNNNGSQQPAADQAATNNANATQQPQAQTQPAQTQPAPVPQPQAAPQATVNDAITAFINSNFSGAAISRSERDDDGEIEVYLNDGSKVEFTANNEWKKITCSGKGVPAALVPQAITNYVNTNHQSTIINKIEKNYGGYEIQLINGVEMHFDSNGNFLSVDMDD